MLRSRVIPCLLMQNKQLIKTVNFKSPKYIGDPLNAVKIFNEKQVDELIILDINASAENLEPDYAFIANLANECRMPFCYGGGIKTKEQAQKIIKLGVEKIALGSAAIKTPDLIAECAQLIGKQSVVVVLDIKKNIFGNYEAYILNGKVKVRGNWLEWLRKVESFGAGEVVINAIHRDGKMTGYDLDLIRLAREAIDIPITALGGAGTLGDIKGLVSKYKIIGAAAGSLFVFKGTYRAVLINYPRADEVTEPE